MKKILLIAIVTIVSMQSCLAQRHYNNNRHSQRYYQPSKVERTARDVIAIATAVEIVADAVDRVSNKKNNSQRVVVVNEAQSGGYNNDWQRFYTNGMIFDHYKVVKDRYGYVAYAFDYGMKDLYITYGRTVALRQNGRLVKVRAGRDYLEIR